ncbi:MAG TPA: hypothetical protein PKC76_04230 [Saprospiraceae bacterium]|nr:hypothetical protein [Saprospiraceae bacterium]HMP23311.1 hypothetical protein [Saprospiraceae bacterium]
MRKLYLLLGIALLTAGSLEAQRLEKFPEERAAFYAELGNYMTASKQKNMEDLYKEFEKNLKSGLFSEEEFQQIQKTSNTMLHYRMTASPYFQDYLQALMSVKKTADPEATFQGWHAILDTMLADIENQRLNPFLEFIRFSRHFFEQRTLRASDLGSNWYALTDQYEWRYQNKLPSLFFPKLDLMAGHRQDSIFIYETAGEYFPVAQIWQGKGGKVTWARLADMDEVYAVLGEYQIETKKSLYEVKDAKLHYPQFFGNRLVPGTFSDKLVFGNDATSGSYPRFESNENRLTLNDIGKGIQYIGGFRLHGSTVYGYGSKSNKAEVRVNDEKTRISFRGAAELFTIRRGELIVADRVETVMYFGQDSIYHPSVNIRYKIDKNEVQLSRGQRGSDRNPFFSSVHQLNIDSEDITAYLDGDSIVVGKRVLKPLYKGEVNFESLHYFNQGDYQRIQNIATANPIAIMKATAERERTNVIDADLLAKRINARFTVDNIQGLLYDLVAKGFVGYDSEKQLVEIKNKVFHYADADQKKVDYDLLKIRSNTDETNAIINLNDNAMLINGVPRVEFSLRQKVGLLPTGNQIVLRPNRNMDFDGRLFAGYSTLTGKDFHFDYEKFQIKLDSVRYFDLFVPTDQKDDRGEPIAYGLASRIEHLSGVLLIDAPRNKSGREDIPTFPSLQTNSDAYVFYDIDSTQAAIYPRDSFYFRVAPFSFNQLDEFQAKDIQFKGELHSADIFPDFKETLRLQNDDFSLGFISKTPKEGYPVYQGKGVYTGNVNLSNKGLQGEGNLRYLGASIDARGIAFRPEDMSARADQFNLDEDRTSEVQTPRVRGVDVSIDWRPYQDSMYIRSETAPFKLFNKDNHTLNGTLVLTPGGLKGKGTLDWDEANMTSNLFAFGAFSAKADTTDLKIKALNAADLALKTSNVQGDVDFDREVGNFKANDEFLVTTLPYNQYETSMNEFSWDMKAERITFKSEENRLGRFLSIHPDQDSLRFQGANASYDLKTSELQISGVPNIIAADAFIYPDSGYVEIQSGGIMTTLENARIVCDTVNQNHVINRATVNIQGRKFYRASGFYEYNIGNREQEIEFQEITGQPIGKGSYRNRPSVTRAVGEVRAESGFYIDHKTEFYGTISLSAETKNLKFDGFARINAEKLPNKYWFTVSSEGDKKDLAIRYNTPKSADGEPLETGLYLSKETARIYPRVMTPLLFRKDRPIFPAKGVFKYIENNDQFLFGDSSKVLTNAMRGNQFVFKNRDGSVEAEGRFNLGSGLKYVTIDAAGIAKTAFPPIVENPELVSDTASLIAPMRDETPEMPLTAELMLGVQFKLPDQLLKILYNDITSSFDASIVTYLTDVNFYKKAASEIFPNNTEVETAIIGMSSGYLDIPKKHNPYTFVFSRAKMKWNSEYQSFLTTDPKIGITSINGEPIHKMLTCYIECRMPSNEDDRLYIYIKTSSELIYFFGYRQGILSVTSNNASFMDALNAIKAKDLVFKMPDGETYEIQPVELSDAQLFLRRMQAAGK